MSERQYLWGLGSKTKQIKENVFNYFHREPEADTTATVQQTVHATGVGLTTVYTISFENLFLKCMVKIKINTFLKKKE